MKYTSYLYKKTERKKENTYTDFLTHYNHNHDKLGRFASNSSMRENGWRDLDNEKDYVIKKRNQN